MAFITSAPVWIVLGLVIISQVSDAYPPTCDGNAVCIGYYSGFNCTCNRGYKGSDGGCVNIDECVEMPEVCTEAETCYDSIGSYNCTCGDIDTICHDLAQCINGTNSTSCVCNVGYTGNGTFCYDINECELDSHFCSPDANCSNTIGSYTCACHDGYEGNGWLCTDVDECEREMHDCVLPLTCNNTKGSYDCVCGEDGFCHENGYCVNLENSTFCVCKPGYFGNGVKCADVDECESEDNDCHSNASCTNTEGSYRCTCDEGYKGNGKECNAGNVLSISVGLFVLSFTTSILSYGSS